MDEAEIIRLALASVDVPVDDLPEPVLIPECNVSPAVTNDELQSG